ncbi:MAG TPA: T9SS type A sorting domain-containing protein [Ignavibacteriaceae bacterium]
MKKIMYSLFLLSCLFLLSSASFPQLNFEENFDYPAGDTLNTHGWVAHSAAGSNVSLIVSGSLSYPGYASSNIGNSVDLIGGSGSREDVTATFNIDSVSNVYCSFLVKVASVGPTPDYFFHFREDPVAAILRGRVFIRDNGTGGFNFGMSKGSTSLIDWDTTARTLTETYLVVLKYEYVVGTGNDLIHLFINPSLTAGEPATPNATVPDTSGSDIIVNAVSLRQGSNAYNAQLDGIRVSTSWSFAPLPVELVNFNAQVSEGSVLLGWSTASETNNKGFEIERKFGNTDYSTLGFVNGVGNSTEQQLYSFLDSKIQSGTYAYRLKQIDYNGTFKYSHEIQIDVKAPLTFSLNQNYPNPFNPSTKISWQLPVDAHQTLRVYDVLGNEVVTLIDDFKPAGNYEIEFTSEGLSSSVYFYQLQAGNFVQIKKMVLIR